MEQIKQLGAMLEAMRSAWRAGDLHSNPSEDHLGDNEEEKN